MQSTAMKLSSKPYVLTVQKRPGYLHALLRGSVSQPETALDYLKEIANACRKYTCTKVVIEMDVPQAFAVWDLFFVATNFPRLGIELTKIAVVDKGMEKYDRNEFSVMVGRKHGLDVHVFANVGEAERWVLAG